LATHLQVDALNVIVSRARMEPKICLFDPQCVSKTITSRA
jgi:hypothetical protein